MQSLTADERADVLRRLADLLQSRKQEILRANSEDMAASEAAGKVCHRSLSSYSLFMYLIVCIFMKLKEQDRVIIQLCVSTNEQMCLLVSLFEKHEKTTTTITKLTYTLLLFFLSMISFCTRLDV